MSEVKHYTIVTTRGLEKIQAKYQTDQTVNLTHMGFGGTSEYIAPNAAATVVPNQWAKVPLERHPDTGFIGGGATVSNKEEYKGHWLGSVGIYDEDDELILIAATPLVEISLDESVVASYPIDLYTVLDNASSVVVVTDTSMTYATHDELNAAIESVEKKLPIAATDKDIDTESIEKKMIELPQFWRALTPKRLIDKLWLGLAAKIFPVGAAIPWFTDIAPEGFGIMKNQAFDLVANPELAKIWPNGIIPDMRGCGVMGKEEGEIIGAYEKGQVIEHGHPDSVVYSTDVGNKLSSTGGSHMHPYRWARGKATNGGLYMERGETQPGYNTTSNGPVGGAGNHNHTVAIGSHAHAVMIALFGALKNTIDHRKVNWIVRMA